MEWLITAGIIAGAMTFLAIHFVMVSVWPTMSEASGPIGSRLKFGCCYCRGKQEPEEPEVK